MLVNRDAEQDVMYTKDQKGNMIQVTQIQDHSKKIGDRLMGDYDILCFPILVLSYKGLESLTDILESRSKLQEEIKQKDAQMEKNKKEYEDLKRSYRQLAARKWWHFNLFSYKKGVDY